jgi:hypothetical protein
VFIETISARGPASKSSHTREEWSSSPKSGHVRGCGGWRHRAAVLEGPSPTAGIGHVWSYTGLHAYMVKGTHMWWRAAVAMDPAVEVILAITRPGSW